MILYIFLLYNKSMIETKRRSLILNIVLTTIILIIGFLFWPGKEKFNQSNPRDVNKTQIKIKVKALNIREKATVESKDIGTVYMGEIFTVLEHIDADDYYWYKIKTKQGTTGYIASDRNNEYVDVVSGLVDREAPVINVKNGFIIFKNGEESYDDVTCTDNYSKCELSYEIVEDKVVIKAVDTASNESVLEVKYYNVYDLSTLFNENNENINVTITKNETDKNFIINANYITNIVILDANKSKTYTPIIHYYDESFNEINDMYTLINKQHLGGICINDESNTLKKEYQNSDIPRGSILCMNYTFNDKNDKIKYIRIGFKSLDNIDNAGNSLKEYTSKLFELN